MPIFRARTQTRRRPYAKRRRQTSNRLRRAVRKPKRRVSSVRRTLPDYTVVALKYQNVITGFGFNDVPQTQRQWRLNSLFDPNYTATNAGQHQPFGFVY